MTYKEYKSLEVGDVVYMVAIRWREMVIEKHEVIKVFTIPHRSPWIDGGIFGRGQKVDADLCFLNLDEASQRLEKIINNSNKKRRKAYDLAKPKYKKLYVKELITI